ncbi:MULTISPECIES: P44/Msp2 family outer membrane protein [Wolbachia]|uniref:P44/Msp2 family outer membrane protein n=1 Tax=Wolbachia TaxID=953 RepID=UPI00004CA5C5|nr:MULTISPECIES: P44/Msp2 family outer membrane protein [Wolbachia]MDX5488003.1 P44/Msp2 family outer membrane protein [Wolbachia endosymbiont of Andrena praecox]MDX5497529.1 P44/Msp2 family outer membrane protein [Wolbachia endosymbiont of Lasioglossum nitidulum]MDX5510384.1 P44/Msp2 family outer membrane protein [Wolbachia endosymbiont of Lasioglossum morio]MDX5542869.1 P44/Msp2 family outer membrane protein [Wolbachia endosymbiont of Andrena apicata]MDX5561339.1 P44/Msp2 family outer membra
MISKKTLAVTALALLLSQQSFASETEGFYFGSGYYGQYLNYTGELKAKIGDTAATATNNVSVNDRSAQNTEGQSLSKYKGDYNPPFAANVALGYTGELNGNSYRAELEGMYSSVKVDNIGLTSGQMTISYTKDKTRPEESYGAIVNHDQIENISVMANVYHHWKSDRFSFSPYVGVGVGATRMTMFEKSSIRPAGQLKAGLDYRINEDVNMHIGYRGFGAIGSSEYKLDTLKWDPNHDNGKDKPKGGMAEQTGDNQVSTTIQNDFFHTHGIEAGLTFHFASKA